MNLFSLTTMGFYAQALREDYESAGTLPEDAIAIDAKTEQALRAAIEKGAVIRRMGDAWDITAAAPRPFEEVAAPRMAAFRQNREIALNRLSGLGFAALLAGDTAHAQEVASVRSALLDVPALPQVKDAASLDALDAALNAAWESAYVDSESEAVATAMAVGAGGGQTRPT